MMYRETPVKFQLRLSHADDHILNYMSNNTPSWHWTKQPNAEEIKKRCVKHLIPGSKGNQPISMIGNKFAEGNKHTPEWKKVASEKRLGNSYGFKKGLIPWNKGIKFEAVTGEKNINWKGGISKQNRTERQVFMQTPEYRDWRRKVFERDNYTCQKCGYCGEKLEANHDLPYATFPELRTEILNGETLCAPCHLLVTRKQREFKLLDTITCR